MMAKNSRDRGALKRLRVFRGAEHKHAAQKPVIWSPGPDTQGQGGAK